MRQLLLMHEGEQAGGASGSRVAAAPSWAGWRDTGMPAPAAPSSNPACLPGPHTGVCRVVRASSVMTSGALDVGESSHAQAGTEREASFPFVRAVSWVPHASAVTEQNPNSPVPRCNPHTEQMTQVILLLSLFMEEEPES